VFGKIVVPLLVGSKRRRRVTLTLDLEDRSIIVPPKI
jgi:hypothetical protein